MSANNTVKKTRKVTEWNGEMVPLAVLEVRANMKRNAEELLEGQIRIIEAARERMDKKISELRYKKNHLYEKDKYHLSHFAFTAREYGAIGVRVEGSSAVYVLPDHKVIKRFSGEWAETPVIEEDDQ